MFNYLLSISLKMSGGDLRVWLDSVGCQNIVYFYILRIFQYFFEKNLKIKLFILICKNLVACRDQPIPLSRPAETNQKV